MNRDTYCDTTEIETKDNICKIERLSFAFFPFNQSFINQSFSSFSEAESESALASLFNL